MIVAIIDYGSGNLRSAEKAFQRAARETGISASIEVTGDPDLVRKAERIVLPGVGAFRDCRDGLQAVSGMVETIEQHVAAGKPFLGILRRHAVDGGKGPRAWRDKWVRLDPRCRPLDCPG